MDYTVRPCLKRTKHGFCLHPTGPPRTSLRTVKQGGRAGVLGRPHPQPERWLRCNPGAERLWVKMSNWTSAKPLASTSTSLKLWDIYCSTCKPCINSRLNPEREDQHTLKTEKQRVCFRQRKPAQWRMCRHWLNRGHQETD